MFWVPFKVQSALIPEDPVKLSQSLWKPLFFTLIETTPDIPTSCFYRKLFTNEFAIIKIRLTFNSDTLSTKVPLDSAKPLKIGFFVALSEVCGATTNQIMNGTER